MKTTEEEIKELEAKLKKLKDKVKKENEFKVGDWVIVLPEDLFYSNCEQDKPQRIRAIRDYTSLRYELEFSDGKTNTYNLVRKATQEEIKAYQEANKPIEISGYKAEFNKANKTVSFGCKKDITKKDLEAILTVMNLNEKFDEEFVIGEKYLSSVDEKDFSDPISKETIQKLIDKLEE